MCYGARPCAQGVRLELVMEPSRTSPEQLAQVFMGALAPSAHPWNADPSVVGPAVDAMCRMAAEA